MKSVIDQAIEKRVAKSLGARGGFAGRGAAKARTSEQARAAAQARWAKRQPKSEMPNAKDEARRQEPNEQP